MTMDLFKLETLIYSLIFRFHSRKMFKFVPEGFKDKLIGAYLAGLNYMRVRVNQNNQQTYQATNSPYEQDNNRIQNTTFVKDCCLPCDLTVITIL